MPSIQRDYYEVLSVEKTADGEEIKRAYRRLAMAWHPDRNTHPEATERFKQIRAAYDWLLNRDEEEDEEGAEAANAEPAPATPKAADIRQELEITLNEGASGTRRKIKYQRGRPCSTCKGSGEAGISRSRFCDTCHGSGRVRHRKKGLETCPQCDGKGIFSERICPDCEGSGREEAPVTLAVTIPPGMLDGGELRLAGQGEPGSGELRPGDLYLRIRLKTHDFFELSGRDLILQVPVNALRLIAGGSLAVPGLHGEVTLQLEPGDAAPRTMRVTGGGYPGGRGGVAGDLVVNLQPVMARKLSPRQRKALEQAVSALEEKLHDTLPEVAAWKARVEKHR